MTKEKTMKKPTLTHLINLIRSRIQLTNMIPTRIDLINLKITANLIALATMTNLKDLIVKDPTTRILIATEGLMIVGADIFMADTRLRSPIADLRNLITRRKELIPAVTQALTHDGINQVAFYKMNF